MLTPAQRICITDNQLQYNDIIYFSQYTGILWITYAIYDNDIMVGFIMLSYNEVDEDNDNKSSYWVWRFMIDKHYQGKGHGKKAMAKALELIRTFTYGKATVVFLSYEPENVVAKTLYASFGFVETGKIEYGELVAKLTL